MKRLTLILMPVLCVLWIGVIFYMSSDHNSNIKSEAIAKSLKENVKINSPKLTIENIDYALRKSSHFGEYFILAILLSLTARTYSVKFSKAFIYIVFICLLIANLDEFYQSFTGRGSKVADSLIDLSGAFAGLMLFSVIDTVRSHIYIFVIKPKRRKMF